MGALQAFLKQSFRLPPPALTEKTLPDQNGKVFIVTGSNTGVGYSVAQILFSKNGTVYVAARTESKALAAIKALQEEFPDSKGTLHFLKLDLADLTTIKASVQGFLAKESRLDVLVNNAGVMDPPVGSKSVQGYELQLGTNIVGPFLFTKLLLPILKATAALPNNADSSVRVCWAGSLSMDAQSPRGGVTFNKDGSPAEYTKDTRTAYGVSKAGNFFLGFEFGKRFGNADGVLHNSFNPGNLETELQRHAKEKYPKIATSIIGRVLMHPAVFGAYTELYAGWSKDLTIEQNQGGYIWPWGRSGGARKDVEAELKEGGNSQKLYEWCDSETAKYA